MSRRELPRTEESTRPHIMLNRREPRPGRGRLVALVLAAAGLSATGCAGLTGTLQQQFTPQLQSDARVFAFQAASFTHGFMQGHMVNYEARLLRIENDGIPFFEALERAGWRAEISVLGRTHRGEDSEYEYYEVQFALVSKDPKIKDRFPLPGFIAPASEKTGIPVELLQRGHSVFVETVTLLGGLNASDDSMRRHAFGLLVLKEKLEAGEQADYLAPLRPAEESLEDVEVALRVIADHHRESARMRAEIVGIAALGRLADNSTARAALSEQVQESRRASRDWLDSHHQPTPEDFGVKMQELKLPTPENMLAALDKDGYLAAAAQVAKGVASGDPSMTIEAIGKLAPEGSSIHIASEGVSAAMRGDIATAADSALQLAERQEDIAPLAARLRAVEQTVEEVAAAAERFRD